MSDRFFRLLVQHQKLDDALRVEQKRPFPDFIKLQKLKRLKLRIKDRISALMRRGRILKPS